MPKVRFRRSVVIRSVLAGVLLQAVSCGPDRETGGVSADCPGVHVLLLVAKNYGLNYFFNRDSFEQYGWRVTHAGVTDTVTACPPVAAQIGLPPVLPDLLVSEIEDLSPYDCLVLPPAAGNYTPVPDPFGDIIGSADAIRLVREAQRRGLVIYASCSGVRALAAAGVLQGRRVTGSPKFAEEYEGAGAAFVGKDHPPVIDGNIVTSVRGLYYNVHCGQAIALAGENLRDGRGPKSDPPRGFISSGQAAYTSDRIIWSRTYGGRGADGGRAVCRAPDGGFLVAGYTFSHGDGDADILVIRIDARGGIVWAKSFGGRGTEYGYGCSAVDGGFLVTGYTTSFGAGSRDLYLLKLDGEGNEIWSRAYGGPSWDVGVSVAGDGAGGGVACGYTASFGAGEEDLYIVSVDGDGNEIWSRTYGGERYEMGNRIHRTPDGGMIAGGVTGTWGSGNCDGYVLRLDRDGRELGSAFYGNEGRKGYGYDWYASVHPTLDGGLLLVGSTDCNDILDADLVRIDADGGQAWRHSWGRKPFYDYGHDVCETTNGFLVCGVTKSMDGDNDIYLTSFRPEGDPAWEEAVGGQGSDWASAVSPADDGTCIVVGHTDSYGAGAYDLLVLMIRE